MTDNRKFESEKIEEIKKIQPVTGAMVHIHGSGQWVIDGKTIDYSQSIDLTDGKRKIKLSGLQAEFFIKILTSSDCKAVIDKMVKEEKAALGF